MTIEKELARIDALIEAREKATQGVWEFQISLTTTSRIWQESRDEALYLRCDKNMDIGGDTKFIALAANELKPLLENYKRALEVVRFYGDPESYIKRDRDSWTKKTPEPGEMILGYRHPGREWVGTIVVGGKRAREFLRGLEQNKGDMK